MTPGNWSPHRWSVPRGLEPTPAQARDWLEQELHRGEYQSPWLDSAIRWVVEKLRMLFDGTAMAGFSPAIMALVALVVIALLAWVLPRVRRESRAARLDGAVLEDLAITARTYRDRAAQAIGDGRYDDAVLDGFRAIARDMSDRTLLADAPGLTAKEARLALAPFFPDHADRLARAADLFDAVRYGHRRATADQAGQVQRLDEELVTTRPALAGSSGSSLQDLPV